MGDVRIALVHKTAELDLNDSTRFQVTPSFAPPPVNLVPNIAFGTSANRLSGGSLISTPVTEAVNLYQPSPINV